MVAPITGLNAITPPLNSKNVAASDSTNFAFGVCKAIYVGSGGDISVEMLGEGNSGKTQVFASFPGGQYLIGEFTRVNSTGTTASSMVALY